MWRWDDTWLLTYSASLQALPHAGAGTGLHLHTCCGAFLQISAWNSDPMWQRLARDCRFPSGRRIRLCVGSSSSLTNAQTFHNSRSIKAPEHLFSQASSNAKVKVGKITKANTHHIAYIAATLKDMSEQRFIVDYGTRNLSAGIQILSPGVSESECPAVPLSLQGRGKEELPQLVGYISHEVDDFRQLQFCWGDELAKAAALRDSKVVASFGRLKLAIFGNDVESRNIKSSIEEDLASLDVPEKTADDLFVRHLVAIGGAMRAATTKRYGRNLSLTMKACIFFGIPEIMDLGARQKLVSLLRRACWQQTRLVSETECVYTFTGAWKMAC